MGFKVGVVVGAVGMFAYEVTGEVVGVLHESVVRDGVDGTVRKMQSISGDKDAIRQWTRDLQAARMQRRAEGVTPLVKKDEREAFIEAIREIRRKLNEDPGSAYAGSAVRDSIVEFLNAQREQEPWTGGHKIPGRDA